MPRNGLPAQIRLRSKDDYQSARNLLAYLYQDYKDETLVMVVDEPMDPATKGQRGKTHIWFDVIAAETGHSAREVKEWAMSEFFTPEVHEVFGKQVEIRRSYADLDKAQASYLMEQLQAWAAEQNIILE